MRQWLSFQEHFQGRNAALHPDRRATRVSNFDTTDMLELFRAGGDGCVANQILYNLTERGPEFDLIPLLRSRRIPTMAYSPIGQGMLVGPAGLEPATRPL